MNSQWQCFATSMSDHTFGDGTDGGDSLCFQIGGVHGPVSRRGTSRSLV